MKFIRILTFASTMNIISDQAISLRQSNQNYPSIYPDGHHGHGNFNGRSDSKYRKYYKKIKKLLKALQREGQLIGPNFRRGDRHHFGIGT